MAWNKAFVIEKSTGTSTGSIQYGFTSTDTTNTTGDIVYWDASIQNSYRRSEELRLIEKLTAKYNTEFTCEFCNRANPIENCECERCGAPRKAVEG